MHMSSARESNVAVPGLPGAVPIPLNEYVFLSPEWVHEVTRLVQLARKSDVYFRNLASGFSLSWVYLIHDIPHGLQRHYNGDGRAVIFARVDKGVVRSIEVRRGLPKEKFQLILASDYGVAKRLFLGKSSPLTSFLRGQLKVSPVDGFRQWPKFATKSALIASEVLKVARKVPTAFVPAS